MAQVADSNISNVDRRAITVQFATDTHATCDVKSQIIVFVNSVGVEIEDVVFTSLRIMGITLKDYVKRDDVVTWEYFHGACKIEDIASTTELGVSTPFVVVNAISDNLIIYPEANANSFITVADATLLIESLFFDKSAAWSALDIGKQESLLMQSYIYINTCKGFTIPDTYGDVGDNSKVDFGTAQCFLSVAWMDEDIFATDVDARGIVKEQVGELAVEYDPRYKADVGTQPPFFYRLLSPYGCSGNTKFSQSSVKKG